MTRIARRRMIAGSYTSSFLAAFALLLTTFAPPPSSAGAQAGRGCSVFSPCPNGYSCHTNFTCYNAPRRQGQPCSVAFPCGSGLRCDMDLVCRGPGRAGEGCNAARPCASGLSCDMDFVCRAPGRAGEGCNASRPCGRGLRCDLDLVCRAPGRSGQGCNAARPCQNGLHCDGTTFTCREPGRAGASCNATRPCANGFQCEAMSQICRSPGRINDPCHLTRQCGEGLYCQPVIHKCAPNELNLNSGQLCQALHVDELQAASAGARATLSYGAGGQTMAGAMMSVETGTVYGQNAGEYGCYATVCAGVAPEAGINAYMNLGTYRDYQSFQGQSVATNQGVSTPFVRIGPGFSTSQVMSTSGQLIGANNAVSFGIGLSPLPFSVGAQTCCTAVINGRTGRLRDLASGVNTCRSNLESLGNALTGNRPSGAASAAAPSGGSTSNPRASATGQQVVVGRSVEGRVSSNTPLVNGRAMVVHAFQCRRGQRIRVDLTSQWDNVAAVLTESNQQLAYNDDTNGRNAQIEWTCPDSRRYRIGAGAYSPANTGPYTLQVAEARGSQQATPARPTAQITNGQAVNRYRDSQQVALERVTGTPYVRVLVRGQYLHTERNRLQRGQIRPDWHSAMWELERVQGTSYYRIKNRYRGTYLHTENGAVDAGAIQQGWWSAMWTVRAPR